MPNFEHNIQSKTFETIMEKYTKELLKSDVKTIRNHSIMKKHKTDTEPSKEYWRLKQLKEQVFVIYV